MKWVSMKPKAKVDNSDKTHAAASSEEMMLEKILDEKSLLEMTKCQRDQIGKDEDRERARERVCGSSGRQT